MRHLRLGALIILASLFQLSFSGVASAEDRPGALLPFKGPQANQIRQRVQNRLRAEDVEMVPLKKVTSVARKTKGWVARAKRLKASYLISGKVRSTGDRWVGDIEMRSAKGKRVRKFRVSASTRNRLGNRIADRLIKTKLLPRPPVIIVEEIDTSPIVKLDADKEPAPVRVERQLGPKPKYPRVVIRPFKGSTSSRVRTSVVRALKGQEVILLPNKEFTEKAKSLGSDLSSEDGHVLPARALGVSGLLEADVLFEDGIWSAYIRLVDGSSSKVLNQHYYDGETSGALARDVRTKVWTDFRKDIRRLDPRAAMSVSPAAVAAVKKKPAKDRSPSGAERRYAKQIRKPRPSAVDFEFDFRFTHRSLTYKDTLQDDPRGDLRDYTLKFGPGIGLRLQWYPAAHFTGNVASQFGLDFEYERIFTFDSERDDGPTEGIKKFPTESQQFLIGARWRYPARKWEPGIVVNYGVHDFNFGLDGTSTAEVPSVKYKFVRMGGTMRIKAGSKFAIIAAAAFRLVFDTGGIQSTIWFPDATANGLDARLMVAYILPKGFELRIGTDYRRYWYDLNPVPPNPAWVAGGALDNYWALTIGAAWRD